MLNVSKKTRQKNTETFETIKVSLVLCRLYQMLHEQKILAGVQELFFSYGIKSITMDEIAKHLGMSKKTIYLYYKDKDALIHALMQEHLKMDQENFTKIFLDSLNVVEEVFNIMKNMTERLSKINPLLIYELQKYHPSTWALMIDFKEKFVLKNVEKSLEKGKKDGLVRAEINVEILARLRMQEVEMAFNPAIFPPDKFNLLQVQLELTEHFLYGICTIKGHKLINKYKSLKEKQSI